MKKLSLLQLSAVTLVGAAALVSACSSDDDSGSGGTAGTSSAGKGGGGAANGGSAGKAGGGSGGKASGGSAGAATGGTSAGAGDMPGAAGEGGMAGANGNATMFTLTLENVAKAELYTSSGVFNTPMGDAAAGPATPGKMYQFTVDAGRNQKLSFATMLAATNDLFFGPNGDGIALYDAGGNPITADVTSQVQLWDAGTEVNEEPAVGPNTVGKQAAANTGVDEHGNVVLIKDATDGVHFDYPAVSSIIQVMVAHTAGTHFTVTIKDVSAADALKTSGGNFPAPLSPGVFVIHNGKNPLFTQGMPDVGNGLEHIAEDGNPTALGAFVTANSGITYPASPGVWVVAQGDKMPLFTTGMKDYGDGIEGIAEDGNPTNLGAKLTSLDGYLSGAVFNTPVGAAAAGPILPGSKYQVTFSASPGDALSFATMLAATNDVFFGPKDTGIPLFDDSGKPTSGDVTSLVSLWDAGTEGNEEPGIGPNTVTNQLAPNTGTPGEGKVELLSAVNDGFTYPAVKDVLKITLTPQ